DLLLSSRKTPLSDSFACRSYEYSWSACHPLFGLGEPPPIVFIKLRMPHSANPFDRYSYKCPGGVGPTGGQKIGEKTCTARRAPSGLGTPGSSPAPTSWGERKPRTRRQRGNAVLCRLPQRSPHIGGRLPDRWRG